MKKGCRFDYRAALCKCEYEESLKTKHDKMASGRAMVGGEIVEPASWGAGDRTGSGVGKGGRWCGGVTEEKLENKKDKIANYIKSFFYNIKF